MRTTFPVVASPEAWASLADPVRVAAALPGCRSFGANPDGTLAVVVDLSVASVEGLWSGTVTLLDPDTIRVAGSGAPGTVDLTVRRDPSRSHVTVDGAVDGPLATVGSTVLAAAVRRLADSLLTNLAVPAVTASAPSPAGSDAGAAIRHRGPVGAVAAAAVVTGAVAVVRWRRRRAAG
jgi:carbon monoxide dehydrogenase subunit G